jgi:hypothetical protein
MMHGREKSDSAIVAGKPTNKAGQPAAEPVEPRVEAKGNASQQSTRRTQSRVSVSHALERIRQNRNEKRFAVTHPRREPYARIGPVRICANSLAFGGWPAVPLRAAFERILKYRIVAGKASADATSVPSA